MPLSLDDLTAHSTQKCSDGSASDAVLNAVNVVSLLMTGFHLFNKIRYSSNSFEVSSVKLVTCLFGNK